MSSAFVREGRVVAAGRGVAWIGAGWDLFKRAPALWVGMAAAILVGLAVLSFIPLVGQLLVPLVAGGLVAACRELDEGRRPEFGTLLEGFRRHFWPLFCVGLINMGGIIAAVLAGIGMTGGAREELGAGGILTAALIAAALLVPLAMALWFAVPLVMFQGLGAVDAMIQSFIASLKNWLPFLAYGVVLLPLAVLAAIPALLGWLVLMPVVAGSVYAGYKDVYFKQ